jgi:hypothetical protein
MEMSREKWENLGALVTELIKLAYEFSAWRVIA